ncbi:SDR family NAD(P)-dependent oxidoreductase [Mycobacterium avium]|uniref:SDR family NAD(P)-dependent oxidoreductase n=1 Tax=Mycobacterium avium TaxID=1764 RepID=UPI001CC7859B|nr:SDR family oxidoreductase [Mycobacterium avium]MBZ4521796.1 SDR family oxidoreductase [Mycobacterium avium subsp. hominissuis]MBZ4531192.1 SDR family oxidoreductase [Mycobacterium avium subsp. hominissuis]
MSTLDGKIALVTGAASGIGAQTAALLAERGAAVVLVDVDAERVEQVAESIGAQGGRAKAVAADVTQESQIASAVSTAASAFGGLDILHNNAALQTPDVMGSDGFIAEADLSVWHNVLGVNLLGYVGMAKHSIPLMLERGGGVIINTSSGTGVQAELMRPAYGTSKAAIIGLTRNLAAQYGKRGIRCVALVLGLVGTPALRANMPDAVVDAFVRHQLNTRLTEPRDVAEAVAFLASDAAGAITGTTLTIDGGFSAHTPTYADEIALLGAAMGNGG